MRAGRSLPASFAMGMVRIYQKLVSPSLGRSCRFSPTCSSYAYQSIDRFGVIRGGWLALRRLGRCQPLVEGGYDPVPDRLRLG